MPAFTTSPAALLPLWFGFRAPVSRRAYLLSGLFLLVIKFLGDSWLLLQAGGSPWTPLEYLSPFGAHRLNSFPAVSLGWFAAWSLPFVWIGASMTARRARDAGLSPLVAILFFLPTVNFVLMLVLACAPSAPASGPTAGTQGKDTAATGPFETRETFGPVAETLPGVGMGAVAGGVILAAAFLTLESPYSLGLFVGAPFTMGLVTAFLVNRKQIRSAMSTQALSQLTLITGAGALLLFGIEGLICLAMAYPLAAFLAFLGSLLGRAVARPRRLATSHLVVIVALSPLITALDHAAPSPPSREIVTAVEIDAPPQTVWPHVIAFSELPPPNALAFRLGIAYPMRARIEGEGVGAVRYCEFSTGPFVEPITRWEEPHRLSFDVTSQPPTMQEWSPWNIEPAHLTESLHSERGEFRLIALPGGKTRLEGSTWYRHELFPQAYWNLWSDELIHGIHRRVLSHIAERAEAEPEFGSKVQAVAR
ncbi:MAG: SRPBCC family protein [Acidobacteriota bacterium]